MTILDQLAVEMNLIFLAARFRQIDELARYAGIFVLEVRLFGRLHPFEEILVRLAVIDPQITQRFVAQHHRPQEKSLEFFPIGAQRFRAWSAGHAGHVQARE